MKPPVDPSRVQLPTLGQPSPTQDTKPGGLSRGRFWFVAGSLAVVAAISEMQQLMVIPMLGLLSTELQASVAATSWVLLAALIVGAVSIGPLARLGDKYGPQRVMLWSMSAIMLGNALCAVAIMVSSPAVMIVGRGLIGMNIATTLSVAILKHACTTRQMKQAMGMVTLGLGVGVAPSFLLAGVLTDAGFGLASIFWVATAMSVPVVALSLYMPKSGRTKNVSIPVRSSALLGAWVLPVCIALSFANEWGWWSTSVLTLLVFSAVTFTVWLKNESIARTPLIAPRMLRGDAAIGYYCAACVGLLAYGYYIASSNLVQTPASSGYGFGGSVLDAGLVLLPVAVIVPAVGPLSGRLLHTWGPKRVLIVGGVILTALFVSMSLFRSELWQMYAYAAWFGVGVSLFMPAGWATFSMQAQQSEIGIAGGMAQILQTIFGSLISALGVIFLTQSLIPGTNFSTESGYTSIFVFLAVALGLAVVLASFLRHSGPTASTGVRAH